jgi:hypothetical protein
MTEGLVEPLIYFSINKEVHSLQIQYKQFHNDIEAIDGKLNVISDKKDFEQLDTV